MNYLVLVNKNNKIKNNFINNIDLISVNNIYNKEIKIEKKTYDNYVLLKEYLYSIGIEIGIDTSYRSFNEQEKIKNEYLNKYGEEYTTNYVAPVGYSEHHTGLAVDISIKINGKFLTETEELEGYDEVFSTIHKNLYKFGFILRYPKGKENITTYNYEPWHIRYVGNILAKLIYENNLCLEEYLTKFSGILVVNKEKGYTSRDVVNCVSKILGIKKIGHTGTLDPMAEGVLVLTIGKATKLGNLLTSSKKEYIATVKRGILTDTLDTTGNIIEKSDINNNIDLNKLVKSFEKTYEQEVPLFSAVKVNGKKLYEYGRNNEKVKLPKKKVTIYSMSIVDYDKFEFKCSVSKGTYIRSLIRDMGKSISECFSMNSLIRTKQGMFDIKNSYTISDIEKGNFKILDITEVISGIKEITVDYTVENKIKNGVILDNIYDIDNYVLFKNEKNNPVAIYKKENDCLKMFIML